MDVGRIWQMVCLPMVLYLLSALIHLSEACMCDGPKTLQQHYCTADFVIKTRILRRKAVYDKSSMMPDMPISFRYEAKTYKVFKLEGEESDSVDTHVIYTSSTSCGLMWNINKVYLIAGQVRDGQLWANVCDYSNNWFNLTPHQLKFTKWKYKKHCGCDIKMDSQLPMVSKKMLRKTTRTTCIASKREWPCYALHSYCELPSENGRCSWQWNRPLRECLTNINRTP